VFSLCDEINLSYVIITTFLFFYIFINLSNKKFLSFDFYLKLYLYNSVFNNIILDNREKGVILHDASNNSIIKNVVGNNEEDGFYLEQY
jgi:parallel beta-helix repeat protein